MNVSYEENKDTELKITNFIKKYYYNKYNIPVMMNDDINFQVAGIDIFTIENNKVITYDLKAASSGSYINNPPESFSFSLQSKTRDNRIVPGWLLDNNKINDYYMLIWLNKVNLINNTFYTEDIEELEIYIINKSYLLDYLFSNIIHKDKLNEMIKTKNKNENLGYGFTFVSNGYNKLLMIDKLRLNMLAEKKFKLTKNGVDFIE